MSKKLSKDQKSIYELLSHKDSFFLIPDYQRPYAWEESECAILWNDIYSFAIPDNNYENFNKDTDEYFLGPIVVFKNSDDKLEIIDGQQRITTIMLLLRAFYNSYSDNMQDSNSQTVKKKIECCLWKTNDFDEPDFNYPKIDSEVALDNDKDELKQILLNGNTDKAKSKYAANYKFFLNKINEFKANAPDYFSYLPIRILHYCILLPIEAESLDDALRIFSTLNDRGKPLSDSDIFKAQLYKAFANDGKKDYFIAEWKELEKICSDIFINGADNPMDELFTRYMYYERAKRGIKDSTLERLRKFYEYNNYELLQVKHEQTFKNLISLANFWNDAANQDKSKFSDRILRRLFILNYAPNGMWTYITSVYFLHNHDKDGLLDDEKFYNFLNVITAFIWAFTLIRPGVNSLRTPIFAEMLNIIRGDDVTFSALKFNIDELTRILQNYEFNHHRPITRSMLVLYAFNDEQQELITPLETKLEIEHIYARNRTPHPANLEAIGNKSMLEKKINIRASDFRFQDKQKYYLGNKQDKPGTQIHELIELAKQDDFTEQDINTRSDKIINSFIDFIKQNNLALS